MHRPRTDFHVKRLHDETTLLSPKLLQRHQQILKGHRPSPSDELMLKSQALREYCAVGRGC
jgi:hypothetical protein